MLKVFNKTALTRRQRFSKAILFGLGASLIAGVAVILVWWLTSINPSLLYVGAGFLIGYAIQYFGKGVQLQFSLLAVGLTILVMLVCDLIMYGSFTVILAILVQGGFPSLWEIGYRVFAIILAFRYARVI